VRDHGCEHLVFKMTGIDKFKDQEEIKLLRQEILSCGRKHLVEQLTAGLLSLFQKNGLARGDILPTNTEFGQLLGVSHLTIRKALANLEREGYITQKRGSGTRLNHDFSRAGLTNRTIALVLPGSVNQYRDFINGVIKILGPLNVNLALRDTASVRKSTLETVQSVFKDQQDLAGVIVLPTIDTLLFMQECDSYRNDFTVPVVLVDCPFKLSSLVTVGFDDRAGIGSIFKEFQASGYENICMFYQNTGAPNLRNIERINGFIDICTEYNYDWQQKIYPADLHSDDSLLKEMLKDAASDKPTVILTGNALFAFNLNRIKNSDACLSSQVQIASYDTVSSEFTYPDMISVKRDRFQLGEAAAEALIKAFAANGNLNSFTYNRLIEPELIRGGDQDER